ncbi:MAG: DIP1984 family protein [Solobacterium sp.]|nr:DIP1984 family protein [Solobacterium sp.]
MKLAEALQARADLNKKIAQLRTRIINNALVQEGEKTAENPADLMKQLNDAAAELENLIARINLTNSTVKTDDGTLTECIAKRDVMTMKLSILRDLINEASATAYRARGTEIRIRPAVDVASLQKEADRLARDLRLLDNHIQETNWTTELK